MHQCPGGLISSKTVFIFMFLDEVGFDYSIDFLKFAQKNTANMEKIIGREYELDLLSRY